MRIIENQHLPYGRAYRIADDTLLVADAHDTSLGEFRVIDIRKKNPDVCLEALELAKMDGWIETRYPPVAAGAGE